MYVYLSSYIRSLKGKNRGGEYTLYEGVNCNAWASCFLITTCCTSLVLCYAPRFVASIWPQLMLQLPLGVRRIRFALEEFL